MNENKATISDITNMHYAT